MLKPILYVFVVSLAVAAGAGERPLHPYLNGEEKPISNIFDTSKYGIFQLSNGLAKTPQMGYQDHPFYLFRFFFLSQ